MAQAVLPHERLINPLHPFSDYESKGGGALAGVSREIKQPSKIGTIFSPYTSPFPGFNCPRAMHTH